MRVPRSFFVVLCIGAIVALLAGCGQPATTPTTEPDTDGPSPGGTISMGMEYEPVTLDPHVTGQAIAIRVIRDVIATYIWIEDGVVYPYLAADIDISDDGLEYTLTLREDVVFHDGTPLDANVAKYSFDRITDPDTMSQSAVSALGPSYNRTEVVDDYTIRIFLDEPFAPLLTQLSSPVLGPVSPDAVEALGDDFAKTPVGAGPFYVERWDEQEKTVLKRFEDFDWAPDVFDHSGPALLDSIEFVYVSEPEVRISTLRTGEMDLIEVVPMLEVADLQADPDFVVYVEPYAGSNVQGLINCQKAPTDSLNVRQAILYGVNREQYVERVRGGVPDIINNIMTSGTWTYDPDVGSQYIYDPEKAAELLDEDGWIPGSDGIRVKDGQELTLDIFVIDALVEATENAQFIQSELLPLGFDVQIQAMARPAWFEAITAGEHNMTMAGLWTSEPDRFAMFYRSDERSPFYWSFLDDPEVNDLFKRGQQISDPEEREPIYREIQRRIMDQAATLPIYESLNIMASRATVKGLRFDLQTYPVYYEVYLTE